jgi:hypothetical protein
MNPVALKTGNLKYTPKYPIRKRTLPIINVVPRNNNNYFSSGVLI